MQDLCQNGLIRKKNIKILKGVCQPNNNNKGWFCLKPALEETS